MCVNSEHLIAGRHNQGHIWMPCIINVCFCFLGMGCEFVRWSSAVAGMGAALWILSFFKYAAVRHTWTKVQGAQETNEASIYVMRPRLER